MNKTDVTVIGAGPSGLMLALDLIKQGVKCSILEKRDSIESNLTRAFSVHARTLEVLHIRGLAETLRIRGTAVDSIPLLWGMHARFDRVASIFPEMLVIPQFEIEGVLLEQFRALGGSIMYGAEFLGLDQQSDYVSVRFRHRGEELRIESEYVVGADGHHSSVRQALDIEFVGSCVLPSVIISDARISRPSSDPLTLVANAKGFVFIAPFGEGYHRVLSWDPALRPDDDDAHDFDRLRAMVANILGEDVGVHDPRWISRFSSHERIAVQYRCDRAFLIGDAAHVHSPAGGLGMNLGLQDAVNLGWKLGAVLRRGAPAMLLDSYEREMQPLGQHAVKNSGQLIREATGRSGVSASIKDALLTGVAKIAPLKDMVERGLGRSISGTSSTMLSLSPRRSTSDRHAGTFANELMSNREVLDGLRDYKHVLVAPRGYSGPGNPVAHEDHVRVEIDHHFRGDRPRLIRPDGYIDG